MTSFARRFTLLLVLVLVCDVACSQDKFKEEKPTHADVKYGSAERNVFDFYEAKSEPPTPPPWSAPQTAWSSLRRASETHESTAPSSPVTRHPLLFNDHTHFQFTERVNLLRLRRAINSCWGIMPNYCHAVIRPIDGHDLEELLGQMKGVTANHLNAAIQRAGELWQQECYDRIIRDAVHLHRVSQYIGRNPS